MGLLAVTVLLAGVALIVAGGVLAAQPWVGSLGNPLPAAGFGGGMMNGGFQNVGTGGYGMMGGYGMGGTGMMGGSWDRGLQGPGPGDAGFVAGTASAPRVVRVLAMPNLRFIPETIRVQAGETIRFLVTTMGPTPHEFMVGPAADVAADRDGTPEVADITMMQTASLTYTFSGSGPFAFACHAPGHYEAGMRGTIVVAS